jgi:hypothetical protein
MSNAIDSASGHHKQAPTDQKVNPGLSADPIFRDQGIALCTGTTI